MLDLFLQPIRSALGVAEQEVSTPLADTKRELVDAAHAVNQAAESIEHHVEVIEGLATSVGPLTDSVNQLTATMVDLVTLLAPMGKAEHGVEHVEHFLGFHRHEEPSTPDPGRSDG